MRPRTLTLTGNGSGTTNTDPLRVSWRAPGYSLTFGTSGSSTGFTAQFTGTSPDGYASASAWATAATWHNVTDMAAITASASQKIGGPVQGIRLQANGTGTDTGTLNVIAEED